MATVEIQLRTFYACDEADIAPSITVTVDSDNLDKVSLGRLFDDAVDQMDCGPFTNLRPMEDIEAEQYRQSESYNE